MEFSNIVWSSDKENNQVIHDYLNNILNTNTHIKERLEDDETETHYDIDYLPESKSLSFFFADAEYHGFNMLIKDNKVEICGTRDAENEMDINDQVIEVGYGLLSYIKLSSKCNEI